MGFYTKNGGFIGTTAISDKVGVYDTIASQLLGDSLFPFTSFTFNNAGVTGPNGPTLAQLQASYSGAAFLNNYFTVPTQGFQKWTVPESGDYQFIVRGANGVASTGANAGASGGQGIILSFKYGLDKGQEIILIVGQSGTATSLHGGGGGASAVLKSPYNNPASVIAIAGGGGGRRMGSTGQGISGASYTTYSGYGTRSNANSDSIASPISNSISSSLWVPTLSTLYYGGPAANSGYGDGGAGILGNGYDDSTATTTDAQAILTSAIGGNGSSGASGGFGGGGDGAGGNGGGGGGGLTGGSGGHTAGGGGSFVDSGVYEYVESYDGNITVIGGVSTLYHGYISITKV